MYWLQDLLRDTEDHDLALVVSHFLNCLFGNCQAPGGKATANSAQSKTPKKACPVWLTFNITAAKFPNLLVLFSQDSLN